MCAEQAVNWLVSGRLDLGDETDHPSCVQPVLNQLSIHVNDSLPDDRRHEMWPIILRQPGTAHPEMEPILSIRLACFLAQKVIHLTRRQDRKVCEEAIASALAYCDNPCKETANAARRRRLRRRLRRRQRRRRLRRRRRRQRRRQRRLRRQRQPTPPTPPPTPPTPPTPPPTETAGEP